MKLLKSKSAQGSNYLAVILMIVFVPFIAIVVYTVWIEFVTALASTGLQTDAVTATISDWTNGFRSFDYLTVVLVIGMIIGTGYLNFRIKTRTAFLIVTFILGAFWGFISYFFNYVFIQLVSPAVFSTALGFFPRTLIICTNLHWVMLVVIAVGSLTLYGKKETEEVQTLT